MTIINQVLLWGMIAIAAIGLYILYNKKYCLIDRESKVKFDDKSRIMYYAILFVLLILAIFLRAYRLSEAPWGVNQDEAMGAYDGKALAFYATDRFGMYLPVQFTAWDFAQMSVMGSYLMIPFIRLFGFGVTQIRIPMVLFSVIGIVVSYFIALEIGKELFGKEREWERRIFALIVAILITINPWHLMQSRWALDCNMLPHFFMIAFLFLCKGRKKTRYYYLSMIFFAGAMYCYGLAYISVPIFLVASCIYLFVKKEIKWFEILICALIYVVLSMPINLVMMINTFGWETIETPIFTSALFPNSVRSGDLLFFSENRLSQLWLNIQAMLDVTFLQNQKSGMNTIKEFGTVYLCSLPFVLLGIVVLFKKAKGNTVLQLFKIFFLSALSVGLIAREVNENRMNIVYYPIIILLGIGIYSVILAFKSQKIRIIIAGSYLLLFIMFVNTYFNSYQDTLGWYFNAGLQQSLDYADTLYPDKYYISQDVVYGRDGFSGTVEILTVFNQDLDIPYFQGKTNTNHGKEVLPYEERYQYITFSEDEIEILENEVYILPEKYWEVIDDSIYNKTRFLNFFVVERK